MTSSWGDLLMGPALRSENAMENFRMHLDEDQLSF